jgi:hypothetical protein
MRKTPKPEWHNSSNTKWLGYNKQFMRKANNVNLPAIILEKFRTKRNNPKAVRKRTEKSCKEALKTMPLDNQILGHINVICSDLFYYRDVTKGQGGLRVLKSEIFWTGENSVMNNKKKRGRRKLIHAYVSGVIDCLQDCKFIDLEPGFEGRIQIDEAGKEVSGGQCTRIRATQKLINLAREHGVDIEDIEISDDEPVVTLKVKTGRKITRRKRKEIVIKEEVGGDETVITDEGKPWEKKKKWIWEEYEDDEWVVKPVPYKDAPPHIQETISVLKQLNSLLSKTDILYKWFRINTISGKKMYAHHTDFKFYQRKFKYDFQCSGRLYSKWQSFVERDHRPKDLRINGQRVCELDYSALHPKLLFTEQGIAYEDDPYTVPSLQEHSIFDLSLFDPETTKIRIRSLTKLAFNMGVNAPNMEMAYKALRNEINNDTGLKSGSKKYKLLLKKNLSDDNLNVIFQEFKLEHPMIAGSFGDSVWRRLHKMDSDIALDVVKGLLEDDIVCLPLHDSFLVEEQYMDRLKQQMIDSFQKVTGVLIKDPDRFIH